MMGIYFALCPACKDVGKGTSLSVPRPTNAAGMPIEDTITQEQFFTFLESEMRKIEEFTNGQVCIWPSPMPFLN